MVSFHLILKVKEDGKILMYENWIKQRSTDDISNVSCCFVSIR